MSYTPGYSANVTDFMARRRLDTHGAFVKPYLRDGMRVLDLGCGPGTLTLDLAHSIPSGTVLGVDRESSQVKIARERANSAGVDNVTFEVRNAANFAGAAAEFDLIFSHALFEHLARPVEILIRMRDCLRHGGRIALRSPDWGGWVLHPETEGVSQAISAYERLQNRGGGDSHAGRKLGAWLRQAGYQDVVVSASYEIYPSTREIAEYLARQLEREEDTESANALREWAADSESLFAQSWFEAVGMRP